jgi:hypothetical protein
MWKKGNLGQGISVSSEGRSVRSDTLMWGRGWLGVFNGRNNLFER